MRRNHSLIESIDTSLIIHFPLDSENGLTDVISGNNLSLTGNGSFEWDLNVNMYKLTMPTTLYSYIGYIPITWSFPNNCYTVMSKNMKYSNTANGSVYSGGMLSTTSDVRNVNGTTTMYNGTSNAVRWEITTQFNIAVTFNGNTGYRYIYQNGLLYLTSNLGTSHSWFPNNVGFSVPNRFIFGYSYDNNSKTGASCYVKDYRMYNRVLTLSEIRQIQGYE